VAHFDKKRRYKWVYNPYPDFNPKQIIGKRDDEINQNKGTEQLMLMKKQVIETGSSNRKTISFTVADTDRTYDVVINPVFDQKGEVIGGTSAAFDITEQAVENDIE